MKKMKKAAVGLAIALALGACGGSSDSNTKSFSALTVVNEFKTAGLPITKSRSIGTRLERTSAPILLRVTQGGVVERTLEQLREEIQGHPPKLP